MAKDVSIIVVGVALLGLVWIAWAQFEVWREAAVGGEHKRQVCTMEAKLCPDGSYVGRTGPNCEFAPCTPR